MLTPGSLMPTLTCAAADTHVPTAKQIARMIDRMSFSGKPSG
jgi:hypothetical protein